MKAWGSGRGRRCVAAVSTVVVGVALAAVVTAGGAGPASAGVPAGGMTAAQVASMFGAYGDAGGHWTGGDGTVSVLLPDGRVAWLFSDTFLGTVNADGSRPATTPMVTNTLVVQDGTALTTTMHGGSAAMPEPLVKPAAADQFLWVGDALVESGELKVIYNRFRRYGNGSLDVEPTGTSLATFALPGLTLTGVVDLPVGRSVQWGAAVLADGAYTYIYGNSSGLGGTKFGHLARAAAGSLGGAWQYWTGSGWAATESAAARLISGVGNSFAIQKVGGQYVLVTQEANTIFDPQFVAYTAPSPSGPFSGPIQLLTAPEQVAGTEKIVYTARLHPDLARPGKLLMSYDVNSLANADNYADARLYRPRFAELDWPRPQPDPSTLPAAPGGLAATPDATGRVRLQWTAASGANGYYVYRRDVTNGQTHFSRQRQRLTTTSADVAGLVTGHRYEFKVTAANAVGEGPYSATVVATARVVTDARVILLANTPKAVPGYYLVRLEDTPATRSRGVEAYARELLGQSGGTLDRLYPRTLNGFSAALTEAQAIDIAGHPDVAEVQQDQEVSATSGGVQGPAPEPPWGLDRIDQRDPLLDKLYHYPNDAGDVNVYVVDSGVKLDHNEFIGRIVAGRNTYDFNNDPSDCNGHGTHVAGTVGGTRWGVAKGVRITAVKVLGCNAKGTMRGMAEGVEWAVANARRPAVVNLSIGDHVVLPRDRYTLLDQAASKAVEEGITVVAAAGNDNADACDFTPARAPGVIAVGAMTRGSARWVADPAQGSNFGDCVDLFAPGAGVESAYLPGADSTEVLDGTSMAAPHVAGAAAMILQAHPGYSPAQVQQALVEASTKGVVTGAMSANNHLLYIERPPAAAPTNLTATPEPDGTVKLAWSAVSLPGAHYLVSRKDLTAGETGFTRGEEQYRQASAVVGELVEGHTYEFTVAAANGMGTGPESNVATATARTAPPAAPTGLTATPNADGTIKLTWQPPAPELWYEVYQRDVTAEETGFTRLPLPIVDCCTMTASYLAHGHEYEFKVTASNRGGEGAASNTARATARYPVPRPPTALRATARDGEVELTWTASPTPGVWYWIYQRNVADEEAEATRLPLPLTTCCTMTPGYLTNGEEYEFSVSATGPGGESARTSPVRATPNKELPGKVTGLTATPQADGSITLAWSEPANGPHYYEIHRRDMTAGETAFTKLGLPAECCSINIALLEHDHRYEFKVGATNGRPGPLSDPVQAVSDYDPPAAPRNLTGRAAGDGSVDLDFDPPSPGNFYYWGYYRDVTAEQQGFTKLGLPTERTALSIAPLVHGHVYEFKVSAANQGGEGPATAPIRVTATGGLPQPPSGLTAQAGDGRVTLRWTASPSANAWYLVEYRPAGGAWQRIEIPVTGCCAHTVSLLNNGTTYDFRLRALNASGASLASNVATAKPMPPLPQPPSALSATAGDGRVTLRWTASPTPNAWYWLETRANGGAWKRNPVPIASCCTHTASLLANGTVYDFRLRATNIAGDSAPSNVATAKPMPPLPQPPSALSATAGDGRVTLRWTRSSTANVWYWLETRANGGAWKRNPVPIASCCTHTVTFLVNGTVYDFRLRATNLSGDSAASNVVTARPLPPVPAPPPALHARPLFNAVDLTWTPSPSPNVLYFVHYRDADRGGPWVKAAWPVAGNAVTIKPLRFATLYQFRITAANVFFESAPSGVTQARTLMGGCTNTASTPTLVPMAQWDEVWAVNNTRCDGTVYGVDVTVNLMVKYSDLDPWKVWESNTERWGTVTTRRAGDSVVRFRHVTDEFCAGFLTQAVTYWTYANGHRVSTISLSPRVLVACV